MSMTYDGEAIAASIKEAKELRPGNEATCTHYDESKRALIVVRTPAGVDVYCSDACFTAHTNPRSRT
jgi:hypothetical protein